MEHNGHILLNMDPAHGKHPRIILVHYARENDWTSGPAHSCAFCELPRNADEIRLKTKATARRNRGRGIRQKTTEHIEGENRRRRVAYYCETEKTQRSGADAIYPGNTHSQRRKTTTRSHRRTGDGRSATHHRQNSAGRAWALTCKQTNSNLSVTGELGNSVSGRWRRKPRKKRIHADARMNGRQTHSTEKRNRCKAASAPHQK